MYWRTIIAFVLRFQRRRRGKRIRRYGIPLVVFIVLFFMKGLIYPFMGIEAPFLLLMFIVILSAWYGGMGPGLMVTAFAALLNDFFFLAPKFTLLGLTHLGATLIFILEGICISIISEAQKQADDQKNEFIALAGHELKNPLTVIKGYADFAQKYAQRKKDTRLMLYTDKIQEYTHNTIEMINDLLDVARIEAGELSFHKERFLLYDLVKSLVEDQSFVIKSHLIELSGKSKRVVYMDRHRIGQVIINLITNAAKYSPEGKKILVRISDEKEYVTVRVKDFGDGISWNLQKRIFSRYFRGEAKHSRVQGLGIGLYISAQIVRQHDGLLGVKSKKGKGATFYLKLPVVLKT